MCVSICSVLVSAVCWYLQCVMYQLLVLIIDPHIWLVPTLQLPSSSTPCVLPPLSDVSPQQNDNEIYNAAFSPGRTISASHLLCSEQNLARAGQWTGLGSAERVTSQQWCHLHVLQQLKHTASIVTCHSFYWNSSLTFKKPKVTSTVQILVHHVNINQKWKLSNIL